jgi:maltooligosyltrehalose synthase
VRPQGHEVLERAYAKRTRIAADGHGLVSKKKKEIMETILIVEVRSFGHRLELLAEQDWYARDLPVEGLTQALLEATAGLRVYRTYVRNVDVTLGMPHYIQDAMDEARRRWFEEGRCVP